LEIQTPDLPLHTMEIQHIKVRLPDHCESTRNVPWMPCRLMRRRGSVTKINGWKNGPPNEANVSLEWVGVCHGTAYTLHTIGVSNGEVTINASCRVSFKARAWAYCPVGISP
jgi:hypothetical protein